jgi:hypothetical protein
MKKLISILPKYNIGFEYLYMVKNKREDHLFYGNTSLVPEEKRVEVLKFYEQAKIDGWVYITKGIESVANCFTKADFAKILKENNLPVNGNKEDLANRIAVKLGYDTFQKIGEISNWIKFTDLGKAKMDEYKTAFNTQLTLFKEEVYKMFESNETENACYNVTKFKESYPFNRSDFFTVYTGEELYDICLRIKKSNILKKIGVPKSYNKTLQNTMCMYYCFMDFNYKEKFEEIYNGFEQLLIKSDIIKNKDFPFSDFENYIRGQKIGKFSER